MEKFSKKLHDYLLWQLIKPLNCAKSFLLQSLSMNLQRGNALCVMGTVAHHRKLEEIYNLGTIQTQEQES